MSVINLVALQPFEFEGRSYVRGEVFDAAPAHASAFAFQHWARFAEPGDLTPAPVATKALEVEEPVPVRARKRPYRRRDLKPAVTK